VTLLRLAWKNIATNAARSWIVILCVLFLTGLLFSAVLLVGGAQESLRLVQLRLGADIIVVPEGAESEIESALLMGDTVQVWMPQENRAKIARVPGVSATSSQLYLASLANAPCCTAEMLVMAFDPQTDFTLTPWLRQHLDHELSAGEAVGGSDVFVPYGEEHLRIYGSEIDLVGSMERTGTGLDTALFLTFETAYQVAEKSYSLAIRPLEIPPDHISTVLVRVAPETDPRVIALQIAHEVPGVTAIPTSGLFQTFRKQISGLLRSMVVLLSITAVLSLTIISLIFSMTIHARWLEIGIMRALGATQGEVLQTLLSEAFILALCGSITGIMLTGLAIHLFRNLIVISFAMPLLFPAWPSLITMTGGGLVLGLVGVGLAVLFPVIRASRLDPAEAMRE
jgi:putative ABC transport system permease protein